MMAHSPVAMFGCGLWHDINWQNVKIVSNYLELDKVLQTNKQKTQQH